MHNTLGRGTAQLGIFSGLVTLAGPPDLPQGASPRNQNVDFNVGSVFTRSGLVNPFTYQGNAEGPSSGGIAFDVPISGAAWSNPSNVLLDDAVYATASIVPNLSRSSSSGTAINIPISGDFDWINPANVFGSSGQATAGGTARNFVTSQLVTSNLGISIPAAATISSISVSLVGIVAGISSLLLNAQLTVNGANFGSSQGVTFTTTSSTQSANFSINGSLTPAQIANLGVTFQSSVLFGSSASRSMSINQLVVTVFYSVPSTDGLNVEQFGFSVPSTSSPQGFVVTVKAFASNPGCTLNVQMLKNGIPVGVARPLALSTSLQNLIFGSINDLFGASWVFSDLNNTQFGVQITASGSGTVSVGFVTITAYFVPTLENFNYVTTFEDSFGTIRTLALSNDGEWWIENVTTNPGILSPLMSGAPAGSFASSFTANSRQYIATSDLLQGQYIAQQYNGQWTDQVGQDGPGAPPTFTPVLSNSDSFAISTITQPAAHSRGSSYFLQSTGPGSQSPGNVVTIYYSDSTLAGPDPDLVAAFNSGFPVYMYVSFTGGPVTQGPYVVQVTAVGEGQPPGQPRPFYYFTYNLTTNVYTYYQGSGHPGYTANYQRSLATLTTVVPVPGLEIGNQITISGASVPAYDTQWTITQTPNAGTFTITQTQVSGGEATYSYTLISGANPAAGELVTITGTNNDNGTLNLVNATINSVSGGATGTFTILVSLPDAAASAEGGQATTAGTVFNFDPGAALVGTSTNPIYGNSTGGSLVFEGSGQFITAGTKKGSVFFITRNGLWTRPAPPVTFTIPSNTVGIKASNIPIGPPNMIGRGIIFTESGQEGAPGANFFTIPDPVTYIVQDISYTASSLFINDNTTTNQTFTFPDSVLLNAEAVDIEGFDLFNLIPMPEAAWCMQYAGRSVWGRVRTQIQNFLNMSFDGGYLANPGGNLLPLGWSLDQSSVPDGSPPTLLVSPVFGNSLYVKNNTGSTQAYFCAFYQSAYQDWNDIAILQGQTAYSLRITCRTPGNFTSGDIYIDLVPFDNQTGFGNPLSTYTLPLSQISSTMATYQGVLLPDDTLNIPSNLMIRLRFNLPAGADVEVDDISVFPSLEPTNLTQVLISYKNDFDSIDNVTGGQDTTTVNTQPANGAFTMRDLLYIIKESSMGYLNDSPNQEPANWNPYKEVSNTCGACGINAFTVDKHKGEEWVATACQNGLFLFNGGTPIPIQLEIQDIWNAINWDHAEGISICNDIPNRKIYVAIPLPTPNPWMITTEVNANPETPNVILMLNYEGIGTIENLMEASALHLTMAGNLSVRDFRRKWSLWTIPAPYIGLVKRSELRNIVMFCNGTATSKIYYLGGENTGQDDGKAFTSSYCTYGFVDPEQAESNKMFGQYNKRYAGWDMLSNGSGNASMTFYQNVLEAPYPFAIPGGITLSDPADNDLEGDLDEYAQRLFIEVVMQQGWFQMSRLTLFGAMDKWAPSRGVQS